MPLTAWPPAGAGSVRSGRRPTAAVLLVALGRGERGLGGGETGDRDAERRAGHVVEADRLALPDRLGIAAVLAADAQLDVGPGRPALLDGGLHQGRDGVVERLERVDRQDLERLATAGERHALDVAEEEAALRVVSAVTERHLSQIVCTEAEERRVLRDLVGRERAARYLDHRPEHVFDADAGLRLDGLRLALEDRLGCGELV